MSKKAMMICFGFKVSQMIPDRIDIIEVGKQAQLPSMTVSEVSDAVTTPGTLRQCAVTVCSRYIMVLLVLRTSLARLNPAPPVGPGNLHVLCCRQRTYEDLRDAQDCNLRQ